MFQKANFVFLILVSEERIFCNVVEYSFGVLILDKCSASSFVFKLLSCEQKYYIIQISFESTLIFTRSLKI